MLYTLPTFQPAYEAALMALKPPPPPWEVLQQVSEFVGGKSVKREVDKNVRSLAQSALSRLDVVSREEFDAQADVLQRTRDRVAALEAALEELNREIEALSATR
jgi:BMFP domain-containing protein YqiC